MHGKPVHIEHDEGRLGPIVCQSQVCDLLGIDLPLAICRSLGRLPGKQKPEIATGCGIQALAGFAEEDAIDRVEL